ncbi:MAG: hypothetical protein JKY66_08395 [Spongiibacteraceae bacterium]|nr:hypothetical protein [Spongiibacteraceae bacterium]
MRLGLDFDNTLACYDHVFCALAQQQGVDGAVCTKGKKAIRDAIKSSGPEGETQWMALQGQVYGRYMPAAELFEGVAAFLTSCREREIDVFIVSHKTQYGHFDCQGFDLRQAAMAWMRKKGFFNSEGFALKESQVYFLPTREQKIQMIEDLACDVFIDDLEEVLGHPAFPPWIKKIQYTPHGQGETKLAWESYTAWSDISTVLLGQSHQEDTLNAKELASQLSEGWWKDSAIQVTHCELAGKGGNNQLYRVDTVCSTNERQTFAMKLYDQQGSDTRDRFANETQALRFLEDRGENAIAKFYHGNAQARAALFEWIDGESVNDISNDDVLALVAFITRINSHRHLHCAQHLAHASEACLSAAQLIQQVKERLTRLQEVCLSRSLSDLLEQALFPALKSLSDAVQQRYQALGFSINDELAPDKQILSPSDFGFHNCLRRANGQLVILDFEYFGWDDPVKLTADTLLHPGMALSGEQKELFRSSMINLFSPEDEFFETRLDCFQGLYALRWCAIILNPFLPERWSRMVFSGEKNQQALCEKRLKKATLFYNTHVKVKKQYVNAAV